MLSTKGLSFGRCVSRSLSSLAGAQPGGVYVASAGRVPVTRKQVRPHLHTQLQRAREQPNTVISRSHPIRSDHFDRVGARLLRVLFARAVCAYTFMRTCGRLLCAGPVSGEHGRGRRHRCPARCWHQCRCSNGTLRWQHDEVLRRPVYIQLAYMHAAASRYNHGC